MIQFSEQLGPWSPAVFWFVTINAFLTLGFIGVVIVGGLFDLRFLLAALRSEAVDPTDDGRVEEPPPAAAEADRSARGGTEAANPGTPTKRPD